ncbi:FERM domain containing isoform X2 [Arctopsyche grandis]|uniref:FERM domain containing isoform X2 n=1 Tax=Arctopsyche grandis TaxID=121162 RepID=UPI00406D9B59
MFRSRADSNIVYKCTVRLLEDTDILECEFHPSQKGKYLLDYVCQQLNLVETDYFGLRFVDGMNQRHWLHMAKSIIKQVKDSSSILFSFRVKFYPPNPLLLKEEVTRYQVYLQLKRDLLHGRLYCTPNEAAMLGALVVQGDLGDYDPAVHVGNYISEMRLLLRQTEVIEARMQEVHALPVDEGGVGGQQPADAEITFLRISCQLDTYGVDPHPVKDHRGNQLYLGINHSGIITFQGSRKNHHFRWSEVHKINYEGKMFIVHLNYPEKKHTVGFKCPSGAACRHVWRCAIEQMLFFTLASSADASVISGGGFFSWGSKFRYVGRTEREILQGSSESRGNGTANGEGGGPRRKASSVPATPSTPMNSGAYSSLPRSTHSAPLGESLDTCNGCAMMSTAIGSNNAGEGNSFCPDHILSPVTEEQRSKMFHQGTSGEGTHHFNDYYFRDSFEHSSSESQLTNFGMEAANRGPEESSRHSSNNHTPSKRALTTFQASQNDAAANSGQPKKFNIFKAFVPSFLFVCFSLLFLTVLVLESDWPLLKKFRQWPEMVSLHYHYYRPLKDYMRQTVARLF